jgi:hypothetical protein
MEQITFGAGLTRDRSHRSINIKTELLLPRVFFATALACLHARYKSVLNCPKSQGKIRHYKYAEQGQSPPVSGGYRSPALSRL